MEEQSAHHFAGRVKARDDAAIEILDLAPLRNLKAAEREGDAGGHVVSVKRRGVERVGPVGLVDGEAVGPAAVEDIGIERHLVAARGVEIPQGAQEARRINAGELAGECFQRAGLGLGDPADAVLAAQQAAHLGVEHLPGEHTRQSDDLATVFGVGVAVEIGAFVDVAFALGVDQDTERIIVLLELVADGEVPIGRRVNVPRHRMAAGPVTVGPRPDAHRKVETRAHVEACAAHFREFPTGA